MNPQSVPEEALVRGERHDDRPEIEREIAMIWEAIRCLPASHRDADFFEEGGDSLELLDLVSTIEHRCRVRLPPGMLLAHRVTIAALAQLVADKARQLDTGVLVPLQTEGAQPAFFCVHGVGGNVISLNLLARHMGARRPFIALRCPPGRMPAPTIEDIARDYVDAVVGHQPFGAIALGGYSLGAVIAFEMARQIKAAGRNVAVVAVIDQPPPGRRLSTRTVLPALTRWLADLPAYLTDQSFRDDARAWRWEWRRGVGNVARAVLGRPLAPNVSRFPQLPPDQVLLVAAHAGALARYRPHRCEVPVAVIRSPASAVKRLPGDSTLGWRDLTGSVIAVEEVPGNHYSLTTEPHVRELALALGRILDRVQA